MKEFIKSTSAYYLPEKFLKTVIMFLSKQKTINVKDFLQDLIFSFLEKLNPEILTDNNSMAVKSKLESDCILIINELIGPKPEEEMSTRMILFTLLILDIYHNNSNEINAFKSNLFEEIYLNSKDERNTMILNYFDSLIKTFEKLNNKELKQKMMIKVFRVLLEDLMQRTKFIRIWSKENYRVPLNCIRFVKAFEKNSQFFSAPLKEINDLLGVLCFCFSQNSQLRTIIVNKNALGDLMTIGFDLRANEHEYLESFFKFLEALCFDKEYYHYNICKGILELFYDKSQRKFKKKISLKEFQNKFNSIYPKNKLAFTEAFSTMCDVKENKNHNFVIKLKAGRLFKNISVIYYLIFRYPK